MEELLQIDISIENILRLLPVFISLFYVYRHFTTRNVALRPKLFITFFIFSLGVIQIQSFIYYNSFLTLARAYLLIYLPAVLSLAPLLYLYFSFICQQKAFKIRTRNIIHFIPSILVFILLVIFYCTFTNYEQDTDIYTKALTYFGVLAIYSIKYFFSIQNILYIALIIRLYFIHKKAIKDIFSYEKGVSMKWMRLSIIGYIVFIVSIYLSEILKFFLYDLFLEALLIIYLLYFGYYSIKQLNIYSSSSESKIDLEPKYNSSALKNNEKIEGIKSKLIHWLEKEESYLDPKLTIYDVSKEIQINSKYLSQVINQELNISFIGFINQYRVAKAKELLVAEANQQFTIEAISKMAGFNSKSAFNSAFKKEVDFTPSEFRKNHLK